MSAERSDRFHVRVHEEEVKVMEVKKLSNQRKLTNKAEMRKTFMQRLKGMRIFVASEGQLFFPAISQYHLLQGFNPVSVSLGLISIPEMSSVGFCFW